MVNGVGLANGLNGSGLPQAGAGQHSHFVKGQLIHEGVPHGVIVAILQHIDQLEVGILAGLGELHILAVGQVAVGQHHVLGHLGGHVQLDRAGGDGAFPVVPGIIGDGLAFCALVAVHVRIGKQGGNRIAGAIGHSVGVLVEGLLEAVNQGIVTVVGHAVFGGVALGGQDVVDGGMGVIGSSQEVSAVLQDVHAGAIGVKGGQVVLRDGDGDGFGLTGLQNLGLAVAHQLHAGLFNLICLVVVGVRLLCVNLHSLLAGSIAHVLHVNGDRVGGVLAGTGLFHLHVGHFKVGVAQAEAEGEGNGSAPIELSGLGGAHDHVLIAGLGVLVAQVDAFLVDDILGESGVAAGEVSTGLAIGVSGKIIHDGVCHVVHPPGIGQRTGGIDNTGNHIAHGVQTGLTHGANPHGSVHAQLLVKQEAGGDGVRGVDDDGDGLNHAIVLQPLQALQHFLLVFVQGQIILAVIGGIFLVGASGHIGAFAADTAHHEEGIGAFHLAVIIAQILLDLLPGTLANGVVVTTQVLIGLLGGVILHQVGVLHGQAGLLKYINIVGCARCVHSTGAGAAVDGVNGSNAEQGNLASGSQGQGVCFIFQQDDAFCFHFLHLGKTGGFQLGNGLEGALEVAGVILFQILINFDGFGGGSTQESIDLASIFRRNQIAHISNGEQGGGNVQEYLFQRSFR